MPPKALKLLIRYAFEDLKLTVSRPHIFLDNIASQRLFEHLGFQQEGINRDYVHQKTEFKNVYAYALIRYKPGLHVNMLNFDRITSSRIHDFGSIT